MAERSPPPLQQTGSGDLNRGRTQRRTTGGETPSARLPAERDESVDEPADAPADESAASTLGAAGGAPAADDPLRADMRRAHDDLAQGQRDTDLRGDAAAVLMPRLRRSDRSDGRDDGSNEGRNEGRNDNPGGNDNPGADNARGGRPAAPDPDSPTRNERGSDRT